MSAAEQDRGMRAVERARSVRERDSRVGLQRALAERNEHQARLARLQQHFASSGAAPAADTAAFLAERAAMLSVADAITDERARLASSQQVADAAHAHWSGDKVRLSAVESLLERRAESRRAERERRERTELDDVAGQLWIRAQRAGEPQKNTPTAPGTAAAVRATAPIAQSAAPIAHNAVAPPVVPTVRSPLTQEVPTR